MWAQGVWCEHGREVSHGQQAGVREVNIGGGSDEGGRRIVGRK